MNELKHYGILGMKWGVRRYQNSDGTLTKAGKERYSSDHYKRDKAIYGKSGANRIRKNVETKGYSVSGARSLEATRINRARSASNITGQVGRIAGSVGGLIGGYKASRAFVDLLKVRVPELQDPALNVPVQAAISVGMASVGKTLGYNGGQSLGMIIGGYDPAKYR